MKALYLLLVAVLLIVVAVCGKKNKATFIIAVLFCWSIMAFCSSSYDLRVYQWIYNSGTKQGSSLIFDFIVSSLSSVGITFRQFQAMCAGINILLISRAILKCSKYPAMTLVTFMVYPMLGFATQIRNSVAAAIAIFAVVFYLLRDRKGNSIKYFLCIACASTIHLSAAFFFVFLLVKFRRISLMSWRIVVCLAFAAMFFICSSDLAIRCIADMVPITSIKIWLLNIDETNFLGRSLPIIGHLTGYILFLIANYVVNRRLETGSVDTGYWNHYAMRNVRIINLILLLLIPLYLRSQVFFRLYKYMLVVNYGVMSEAFITRNPLKMYGEKTTGMELIPIAYGAVIMAFAEYGTSEVSTFLNSFSFSAV